MAERGEVANLAPDSEFAVINGVEPLHRLLQEFLLARSHASVAKDGHQPEPGRVSAVVPRLLPLRQQIGYESVTKCSCKRQ